MSRHEVPLDPASALERGLSRLERAGEALRALPEGQVVGALARAARTLRDPSTPLGKQARASLPARQPSRAGARGAAMALPKLVAFDLDATLCECCRR